MVLVQGGRIVRRAVRETSGRDPRFLSQYVSPETVVAADMETAWGVPAFSGKIIATLHPTYFVSDINARRQDNRSLFSESTSRQDRKKLLMKYNARYVLINRDVSQSERLEDVFRQLGRVVHDQDGFVLIKITE